MPVSDHASRRATNNEEASFRRIKQGSRRGAKLVQEVFEFARKHSSEFEKETGHKLPEH